MSVKYLFICAILSITLLSSCTAPTRDAAIDKEEIAPTVKTYVLFDPSSGLSSADTDTATALCEDFLRDYYKARSGDLALDASPYVTSTALLDYIDKYRAQDVSFVSPDAVSFALQELVLQEDARYIFLSWSARTEYEGGGHSGALYQFLVEDQNGRLVIVDWFSVGKHAYSDFERARVQDGRIMNPRIWDDAAWVQAFYERVGTS